MASFTADLHIHSCLSPCGSLDSSPSSIVLIAREKNIDLIALTDHNTGRNLPTFAKACEKYEQAALFGTEVTTAEELHCLVLFKQWKDAYDFGEEIYNSLPSLNFKPDRWGDQVYVNIDDEIEGELDKLLISASSYSLEDLLDAGHRAGALVIPAHIDRMAFSIKSQLGYIPKLPYDALELYHVPSQLDVSDYIGLVHSDAHYPADIGRRYSIIPGDNPGWDELKEALVRPSSIRFSF